MSQVLEHLPDPAGILALARKLLLPDGLLCVVAPNDYNPVQKALREVCGFEPWWVAPPHHINYFSHDSLSRLLEESGFEIVLHTATFPIDMFLLMGDNYVDDDALGRECHKKRMIFEKNLARAGKSKLKSELYSAFADLGLGRQIQITARKK
jgi:SAM-dependent methyltransferase